MWRELLGSVFEEGWLGLLSKGGSENYWGDKVTVIRRLVITSIPIRERELEKWLERGNWREKREVTGGRLGFMWKGSE